MKATHMHDEQHAKTLHEYSITATNAGLETRSSLNEALTS
jgi:hypothetical protein